MERSRSNKSKLARFLCALLLSTLAAQAQVQILYSSISKETVLKRITDVPRQNDAREQKIKSLFADVGCADKLTEQPVKYAKNPNVICTLPGETDEVIIVGAHYDQISPAEGIIDNWSGASLLPTLYESLVDTTRKHTFIFIAFADEEHGLVGSHFYADHMSHEEVARTEAMVNIDSLGLSPSKVWVHNADRNLVSALATVSRTLKLPASEMDVERVGSTDSESFDSRHIPRITIHSVTQNTLHVLHSGDDNARALRPDDYYDSYRLIAAYLAYLDQTLQPRTPKK